MPSKRATITPVSKAENTFISITFGAKICIYSEKPRLCVFYDVASDSPGSIFLVLFWGDCQKRTSKQKCQADGTSPVHLLPLLQFSLIRIAIIVIACHNHMVNQTDIQCFSGFFIASVRRLSALLGVHAPDGWLCTMIKDTAL